MAMKLKLTTIGNSTGLILPKELLEKLRLGKGDEVQVLEVPGGVTIKLWDDDSAREMDVAEKIMRKRRNLLRKLAE